MGYATPAKRHEAMEALRVLEAKQREARELERATARKALATKIVSHLVNQITNTVIRPGPLPEERECYEMEGELRDLSPQLIAEVIAQLNINKGCI